MSERTREELGLWLVKFEDYSHQDIEVMHPGTCLEGWKFDPPKFWDYVRIDYPNRIIWARLRVPS